jgi:hypothetical protein
MVCRGKKFLATLATQKWTKKSEKLPSLRLILGVHMVLLLEEFERAESLGPNFQTKDEK